MIKATLKLILSISLIFTFKSCRVTEKNFIGKYRLDNSPKIILQIKPDNTFEFVKIIPNPYLHAADHPDENFYLTKGIWQRFSKDTIILTSQKDSLIYPLTQIQTFPPKNANFSNLTFFDTQGDTVRLLYIVSSKGTQFKLHGTLSHGLEDLRKIDTFKFHFYGYRPFVFIGGQNENHDYLITLVEEFKPSYFNNTKFLVKRKRIIDTQRRGEFSLVQNGM